MTLFGAIWVAVLAWSFLKKDDEYILFMLLLSGVLQCNNVLVLGGSGIGPFVITSIVFTIRYFAHNFRKYRFSYRVYTILCLWVMLAIIISLVANNANLNIYFINIAQIFSYILCFLTVQKIGYRIDDAVFRKMIVFIIDFVLVVGIIQYFIFIIGIPRHNFIATLLYNDTISTSVAYYATAQMRLFSTFMEPSYCAAFLVGVLFYVCYNYKKIKHPYARICFIVCEIVLTASTTAYVATAICGMIFMLYGRQYKLLIKLVPIAVIGLIIIFVSGRFDSVISNKMESGSAVERTMWNMRALEAFLDSPLYGVGYKNSRASSLFLSIIAEQGLFGLSAFLSICLYNLKILIKKNSSDIVKPAMWFFLGVLVCQLIACPDFDFCVLWMSMYIIGISIGINSVFREKNL